MTASNGTPARDFEYQFGGYRVRGDDLTLRYRTLKLPLAPKVASTLIALLDNAGRFLSKDELLHLVWGETVVEEANLSQNVYSLRKLFDQTSGEAFIETLPKRGYRFSGTVRKQPLLAARVVSPRTRWLIIAASFVAAACIVFVARLDVSKSPIDPYPALSGAAEKEDALGWYYWHGSTEADLRASIQHFRRVAYWVPANPEGYAGEAVAYAKLADLWDGSPSGLVASLSAEKLGARAVAIAPASAIARAARGFVEFDTDGDLRAAAGDLHFAVAADPNLPVAHVWYGAVLLYQGELIPARSELAKAASLGSSSNINYLMALDYYLSRDYQDAIAYAKLETADDWFSQGSRLLLAAAYEQTGQYGLAIGDARQLHTNADDMLVSRCALAQIYASMGWHQQALSELHAVERLAATNSGHPLVVALAYAANRHPSEAFAWLSRMPHSSRVFAGLDPRLDSLRHDPRFARWIHG